MRRRCANSKLNFEYLFFLVSNQDFRSMSFELFPTVEKIEI